MNAKNIIENMKKIGFTEYEVKAYMSLLEKHPLNGYGLSKVSGIPRSRIYDVLQNLEDKQIVFKQLDGESTVYFPLEPHLLVSKLENELHKIIENVKTYTTELYEKNKNEQPMITIKGYDQIMNFIELIIGQAKRRIALSIWDKEMELIINPIKDAINRNVSVRGIYFGEELPIEQLVLHRRIDRYLKEKKERYISVIIDNEQVVSGVISRGSESRATWIKDPGFVEMSEDYISHDVMINAYSRNLEGETKDAFERFTDVSRKNYFDYTDDDILNFD